MRHLEASCNKLKYLLQPGRSTPAVSEKLTTLVHQIQECPAVHKVDVLRDKGALTPLYLRFCELIAQDGDTTDIIRDLRKVAKEELEKSKERLQQFRTLKQLYAQGRHDLAAFFQDNVDDGGYPEIFLVRLFMRRSQPRKPGSRRVSALLRRASEFAMKWTSSA